MSNDWGTIKKDPQVQSQIPAQTPKNNDWGAVKKSGGGWGAVKEDSLEELNRKLRDYLGEGKIADAKELLNAKRDIISKEDYDRLTKELDRTIWVSVSQPTNWASKIEPQDPNFYNATKEKIARIQKLFKETTDKDGNTYLRANHPADGRVDYETAIAMYNFISKKTNETSLDDQANEMEINLGDSVDRAFQWDEKSDKELESLHANQKTNFIKVSINSLLLNTMLAQKVKEWSEADNTNCIWYMLQYLRIKDAGNINVYARLEEALYNKGELKAGDVDVLFEQSEKVAIDQKTIKNIKGKPLSTDKLVCISKFTFRPVEVSSDKGIEIIKDVDFGKRSTLYEYTQFGASNMARLALFKKQLRDSGLELPSCRRGEVIVPDYLTADDIKSLAETYGKNIDPYVHYDINSDSELKDLLNKEIDNAKDPGLKTLLRKLNGYYASLGLVNSGTKPKIYISAEEHVLLSGFISSLDKGSVFYYKMNALRLSINLDNPGGFSRTEKESLIKLAGENEGRRFYWSTLSNLSAQNEGVKALINKVNSSMSGVQDDNNAWFAVFPAVANRTPLTPGSSSITAIKRKYAGETGLLKRLKDLETEINNLTETRLADAKPKQLLSLKAERDSIKAFMDSDSISYDFYQWIVKTYVADQNVLSKIGGKCTAIMNQYLFQGYYSDPDSLNKKNFDDALHVILGANDKMEKLGLGKVWKASGFYTLEPGADGYENLNAGQKAEIQKIKQALSSFITLAALPDGKVSGQINVNAAKNAVLGLLGISSVSSNSVKTDLKSLCTDLYKNFQSLNPAYYQRYLEKGLQGREKDELTPFDLQIIIEYLRYAFAQDPKAAKVITDLSNIVSNNKNKEIVEIKAGTKEYDTLVSARELILGDRYAIKVGDPSSNRIVPSKISAKGFLTYNIPPLDINFLKSIGDNFTPEEKKNLLTVLEASGNKVYQDLKANSGDIPGQFFGQQVFFRVLMPYYIYLGLPIDSARSVVRAITGEQSWSEVAKPLGTTAMAFAMFPRFAPLWYRQMWQELHDGHFGIAMMMFWTANYFTTMGGWNSVWGKTLQPATEFVKLMSKVPGFEKYAKKLPVGWERRFISSMTEQGLNSKFGKGIKIIINPAGAAQKYIINITEESSKSRKAGAKAFEKYNYAIDYAVNKPLSVIEKAKANINDRIVSKELKTEIARIRGIPEKSVTPEEVKLALEYVKKGGSLIFDGDKTKAAVRLSNGNISSTGEGTLKGLFKLKDVVNEAMKEGKGAFRVICGKSGFMMNVKLDGKVEKLAITEIRLVRGLQTPSYIVTAPNNLVKTARYEVTLYLPENPAQDQVAGLLEDAKSSGAVRPDQDKFGKLPETSSFDPATNKKEINSIDVNGKRASWQAMIPGTYKDGSGKPILLRENQVQALELLLKEGDIFLNIGCNNGKTEIGILSALRMAESGKTVHVITSNDGLVNDWETTAKQISNIKIGVIKSGMSHAEKLAAYQCQIVVGADQLIFDSISGEDLGKYKRDCLVVDESDQKLVDGAVNSFNISGQTDIAMNSVLLRRMERAFQNTWDNSYKLYKKMAQYEAENVNGEEKGIKLFEDGKLSEAGVKYVISNNMNKADGLAAEFKRIENIDLAVKVKLEKTLLADLKNGTKKSLTIIYDYEKTKEGEIVIIKEGFPQRGMRWEGGLDEAVRLVEGLKIELNQSTLARISFKQFMKLYNKRVGFSGTLIEDWVMIEKLYPGAKLYDIPNYIPDIELRDSDLASREKMLAKVKEAVGIIKKVNYKGKVKANLVDYTSEEPNKLKDEYYKLLNEGLNGVGKVSQIRRYPVVFAASQEAKYRAIAHEAVFMAMENDGRPVLIPPSSISDVDIIERYVRKEINDIEDPVLRKEFQDNLGKLDARNVFKVEKELIGKAGRRHSILIATTVARGKNIKVDPKAVMEVEMLLKKMGESADVIRTEGNILKGGLHATLVEQDTTRRQTTQKEKRTGRNDNPGSSRMYLCIDDPLFDVLNNEEKVELKKLIEIAPQKQQKLIVLDDASGTVQAINQFVSKALDRNRQNTYQQITRTNIFADTSKNCEATYDKLFGLSFEGNKMVEQLSRDSINGLFEKCKIQDNVPITSEQRAALEKEVKALLGSNVVDLSGIEGVKTTKAAARAVSNKLYEVYEKRYGMDADFAKRANIERYIPDKNKWTATMQDIFMKRYAQYQVELRIIEEKLTNSLVQATGGKPLVDIYAEYESMAKEAYGRMMGNIRVEVFRELFPRGVIKGTIDRIYKLSRPQVKVVAEDVYVVEGSIRAEYERSSIVLKNEKGSTIAFMEGNWSEIKNGNKKLIEPEEACKRIAGNYAARIMQGENVMKVIQEINRLSLNGQKEPILIDIAKGILDKKQPEKLIEFVGGLNGSTENVLTVLKVYKPNSPEIMRLERAIYPSQSLLGGINAEQAIKNPELLIKERNANERIRVSQQIKPLLVQEFGDKLGNEIYNEMKGFTLERLTEIGEKFQTEIRKMSNKEFAEIIGESPEKAALIKSKLEKHTLKEAGGSFVNFTGGMISMVAMSALLNRVWPNMNPSLNFSLTIISGHYVNTGTVGAYQLISRNGMKEGIAAMRSMMKTLTLGKVAVNAPKPLFDIQGFGYGKLSASGWRILMDTLEVKNPKLRSWGEFAAFLAPQTAVGCNSILYKSFGIKVFSKTATKLGGKAVGNAGIKFIPLVGWTLFAGELISSGAEWQFLDPYMLSVVSRAKESWKESTKSNWAAKWGIRISDALVSPFADSIMPMKYVDQVMLGDNIMEKAVFEELGGALFKIAMSMDPYLYEGKAQKTLNPSAEQFGPALKEQFRKFLVQWVKMNGANGVKYMQDILALKHKDGYQPLVNLKIDEKDPENIQISNEFIDFIFKNATFDGKNVCKQVTKVRMEKNRLSSLAKQ